MPPENYYYDEYEEWIISPKFIASALEKAIEEENYELAARLDVQLMESINLTDLM